MSKTTYQISLKGYVGGYDFLPRKRQADNDRTTVDRELAKNEGKQFIDTYNSARALFDEV